MPSFSCDGCGDIVKKPKIPTHKRSCRDSFTISCLDCSTTFRGDDYASHTSCISEAEKVQKSLYKPKKGQPQQNNKSQPTTPNKPEAKPATPAKQEEEPVAEVATPERKTKKRKANDKSEDASKKAKDETVAEVEEEKKNEHETFEQTLTWKWQKVLRKVLKKGTNWEMDKEQAKELVVKKMLSTVQNQLNAKFDEMILVTPFLEVKEDKIKYTGK